MAACASSSIADEALCATDKKENFQRLAGLLMCGGVTLLREVFDSIHPPASLLGKLNDPATKTQLKGAKLTKPEWDCVYPSPGMCGKSTDFDITLLFRLLRTICCLTPPATGWDKLPINADHSLEADLVRIKYYRNSVYGHNRTMEITDIDFAYLWKEISEALLRIAGTISTAKRDEWKESINKLFYDPLTPDAGRYVTELQSWYKKDIDMKDEVEKLRIIMEQMNDKHDKQQEQITMMNTMLQELVTTCIKQNQKIDKQNQQMDTQNQQINICTTIESIKPGGSSITQSQFPNTPIVQQPGLQSKSACIPGPVPTEQPQTEGAVGMSSSWEFQQNDPSDLDIWQVILSSCNFPLLFEKLRMKFDVDVQSSRLGSLVITVSFSSLKVLKGLWKGHCTGHLNEMVQETLVTAEVLQKLCLSEVKLKTIISEKEYKACKELFTEGSENLQQLTRETPSATTTSTSDDSDEKESLKIQEATSQGAVVEPTSLDKRPVSDTVLHDIGSGLGTSWKRLGRCLGIPEKDLKAIDFREHDKERKGIVMLDMWKGTWGEYATMVVLQGALEEIGRTDLSQKGEMKTKMPHRPAAAMAAEPAAYGETKTKMPHRPEVATAEFSTGIFEQTYVKHSEITKGENYIAESGYVMIINNYSFLQRTREGTSVHFDINIPEYLFQSEFGFRCGKHNYLTKSEMLKELTHAAEKDFSTHDCFVCVIQSGGSKDGIFGIDDEVINLETITSLFTRDKCPSLDGKPKIFLIEVSERYQTDEGPGSGPPPLPAISEGDFLIWYAPYIYGRHWFSKTPLVSLAYTLKWYSSSKDLMEILMEVNKEIAEYSFPLLWRPYLVSTLTKKVFLKRGMKR